MSTLKLPIRVQQEIKSYTQFALPMCVVFTERKFHPWILKNFMEIKSSQSISTNGNHFQYAINRMDGNNLKEIEYESVLDISANIWSDIDDHIEFVKGELQRGCYVQHQLDEFYLKAKAAYKKSHFLHPSLIYGFCDVRREFYAVGFSGISFKEFIISYDEMNAATLDLDSNLVANSHKKQDSYSYKLKQQNNTYDFTIFDLNQNLERYFSAPKINDWLYGLGGYQLVLDNLINPYTPECYLKYNTTHFLCEHKKIFNLALGYVFSKNSIRHKLDSLHVEYQKIVSIFENIRWMHMDFMVKDNSGIFIKTKESAKKMHFIIKEAYEMELLFYENVKKQLKWFWW